MPEKKSKEIMNNELSKRTNSCCSKERNMIIISEGWSGVCQKCGRYFYDEPDMCQVLKKYSIDRVIHALRFVPNTRRKNLLIKKISKIKGYEEIKKYAVQKEH